MSEALKAARKSLDELYEQTYGSKTGKLGTALRSINDQEYLGGLSDPRYIPVQNLGPTEADGIAPNEYGVTSRSRWSRFFKEVIVDRGEKDDE